MYIFIFSYIYWFIYLLIYIFINLLIYSTTYFITINIYIYWFIFDLTTGFDSIQIDGSTSFDVGCRAAQSANCLTNASSSLRRRDCLLWRDHLEGVLCTRACKVFAGVVQIYINKSTKNPKISQITKFTEITKYELCNLYILQNKNLKFSIFRKSNIFQIFESILAFVGLFCIIDCYFEYRIRIRCIWLYMGTWFKNIFCDFLNSFFFFFSKNVPEVWTIFVLRMFLICLVIFGPKWSPYVAEASLGKGV